MQREADDCLVSHPAQVGQAFLDRRPTCRAVQLLHDDYAFPELESGFLPTGDGRGGAFLYLCTGCLRLGANDRCSCGQARRKIRLISDCTEGPSRKFLGRCPECQSDDALVYLASRAATLTSVITSHIFSSDFNADRKLLAFTDSVQDASHGAGFLASRTYRFSLRSAIQAVVQASEDGPSLADLPGRVWEVWGERLGAARALATLWPPDLVDHADYLDYIHKPKEAVPAALERDLLRRLSWEITAEYGFNTLVGRTLERTGCSLLHPHLANLAQALDRLSEDMREKLLVVLPDGQDRRRLGAFLRGLLYRLRTRGGIHHPFLEAYSRDPRDRGRWFNLTKKRNRLMSPLASERLPRFLLDGASTEFDHYAAPARRLNWHRDWAARCLGCDRKDDGIFGLYQLTVKRLAEAGLVELAACGALQAAGLRPYGLRATASVTAVRCSHCGHALNVAVSEEDGWNGSACLHFRCPGHYRAAEVVSSYYARLYRSGQVERIFAAEHTGLLARDVREQLEDRFKLSEEPGAPNLLVCTPTLEMGVDVGDLSAVLACSVPPATANYLQRMGRAGRKTGNALCLTMAESRPHDLYFYQAPLEMMRGQVLPPGCFLDAPEMLQRQLVAYAMDQWASQEQSLGSLQNKILPYLSPQGRREFPGRFLDYFSSRPTCRPGRPRSCATSA